MSTRSSSPASTFLIILIVVLTFPLWIGLLGAVVGILGGVFGVVIGIMAAVFGAIVALICLPFKIIFGWHDWDWGWHGFPHFNLNGYVVLAIIILVYLAYRKK